MAGKIDARLKELGLTLPVAAAPAANYIPYTISGNIVFVSGQIAKYGDDLMTGKVGSDLDIAAGQKAARYCALNIIAHVKDACGGDLDRVTRILKLGGFVNAGPAFTGSPQIINGASDLIVDVFGDIGRHARFAVAAACLPLDTAVEIDAIVEIA